MIAVGGWVVRRERCLGFWEWEVESGFGMSRALEDLKLATRELFRGEASM